MKKIIGLILLLLLVGCMTTGPVITDVHRDGNVLVFHKANVRVNTVTCEITEVNSREVRINIK